ARKVSFRQESHPCSSAVDSVAALTAAAPAGAAGDSLHMVPAGIMRRDGRHDVAIGRFGKGTGAGAGERDAGAEYRSVREEKVADPQRVLHASRRNAKRLDQERSNDEEEAGCADDRSDPARTDRPRGSGVRVSLGIRLPTVA